MSVTIESLKQEVDDLSKEVKSLTTALNKGTKAKTKRKPNAFNIFVGETIPKVKAENPELSQSEAFTLATSMWKDHKAKLAAEEEQ